MSVKIFRLQGIYQRVKRTFRFSQEIRALTEDQAREQLYTQLGSFHRVKRNAVTIETVEVIPPEESDNLFIRQLTGAD